MNEFTDHLLLNQYVSSLNVNGRPPPTNELIKGLSVDEFSPDIYVVGLQDLDMSLCNILYNETPQEAALLSAVKNGLSDEVYEVVR